MKSKQTYGATVSLGNTTLDDAQARATAALATVGFGVLTVIDVAQTLRSKLQIDRPGYRILGACHPQLAAQAIDIDPDVGLLMPCNVVVRQTDAGVEVAFIDADALGQLPGTGPLADIMAQANQHLLQAAKTLAQDRA